MRYTLLELVQNISSSIDGDEVNSINDTVESQQIVKLLKTTLDDIVSRGGLTDFKTLFNLVPSGDNTKPVLMSKPDSIDTIDWIKYNRIGVNDTDPIWDDIRFLPPEEFLDYVDHYSPSETDVDYFTLSTSGFTHTIYFKNDTPPQYYTSFDNTYIVFDAYDSAVDTTLQASKTRCYGKKRLEWVELDTFIPPLQASQFQLLLSEATALAWATLRQSPNPKIEQNARRGWRHLQKTRATIPSGLLHTRAHTFDSFPNYSRTR